MHTLVYNRESQRLGRLDCSDWNVSKKSAGDFTPWRCIFFSSSQWDFYCHRRFPGSPGPPLYPDFLMMPFSVHLAVDHGANLYQDVNEMVGRPVWDHLSVVWLPKMVTRSNDESHIASLGSRQTWGLKCCPVTVLNTDNSFCSHLAITGSCVGQELRKYALMNKWFLLVGIRDLNTSVNVAFRFPGP